MPTAADIHGFESSESLEGYAEKVSKRLITGARRLHVPQAQFRVALSFPGAGLDKELVAVVVKYAKKPAGIVTPVHALDTGLVPKGWKVKKDRLEGGVDLTKLDYSVCPVHGDVERYISSEIMMKRARAKKVSVIGSLGFAAAMLKIRERTFSLLNPAVCITSLCH